MTKSLFKRTFAIKRFLRSAVVAALILSMLCLSSCGLFSTKVESISFNDSTISIYEGESLQINLTRVTITPRVATNKKFTVECGDETIASTKNNTVTGLSQGETTLKVTTEDGKKTDTCKLVVLQEEPQSLKIAWTGSLFQKTESLSTVNFSADFGLISAPSQQVVWQVQSAGKVVENDTTLQANKPFSFIPTKAGEFEILARIVIGGDTYSDSVFLRAYDPYVIEPAVEHKEGLLTQAKDDYKNVKFAVSYLDAPSNPLRVVRWHINGGFYMSGDEFNFLPINAGIYKITVEIDGTVRDVATLTANGSLVPQNLRFEYDNTFPNIYLYWDDTGFSNMGFEVQVRDSNGILVHMSGDDGDISTARDGTNSLFLANSVNLSQVIGQSSPKNIFNNKFSIAVRTLGNGDGFTPSEYCQPILTRQIGTAAKTFLENRILDGAKNYYASDFDEFVEIMEYVFYWRENPVIKAGQKFDTASAKVYTEFSVPDEMALLTKAYRYLHITSDVELSVLFSDKIFEYSVVFRADSLPSKDTNPKLSEYAGGLGAARPHINYDRSKDRSSLPIDKKSRTVAVENTEQLFYVASKGFRPLPKKGSKADEVYSYARNILLQIITDNMTDVEKAHAIYDWIMWQTDYDYAVLNVTLLTESVKYKSYYLESIFTNDTVLSVCDGIAKAYALMCNMEGIECIRVTGMAGSYTKGGHAWNKIKIGGEWYIVDATWGDETSYFKGQMDTSRKWEMALHRYFLLTDAEISDTHIEDENSNFPKTALNPYNHYDNEFEFEGQTLNFYISCAENEVADEVQKLVKYMTAMRSEGMDETKPNPMYAYNAFVPGATRSFSNYISFEIKVSPSLARKFNENNCILVNTFLTLFQDKPLIQNTNYFLQRQQNNDALYITVIMPLNLL